MDTRWSKIPVRQRCLISRENKEQRQEVPSFSPLEKENAVQTAVKAKAERGDKRMVNEIGEDPEKEEQNKLKLKRERNEGRNNEKVSRQRKKNRKRKMRGNNRTKRKPRTAIKKINLKKG